MGGALAPPFEHLVYICAASGLAGIRRFWGALWDFFGFPAPGAEIRFFGGFRRPGHVKYSVLGLPGLEKNNAFEAIKHCNLQCFVASKRVFACFGGSRGAPRGLGPPGALLGASGAPSGRFSGAS